MSGTYTQLGSVVSNPIVYKLNEDSKMPVTSCLPLPKICPFSALLLHPPLSFGSETQGSHFSSLGFSLLFCNQGGWSLCPSKLNVWYYLNTLCSCFLSFLCVRTFLVTSSKKFNTEWIKKYENSLLFHLTTPPSKKKKKTSGANLVLGIDIRIGFSFRVESICTLSW